MRGVLRGLVRASVVPVCPGARPRCLLVVPARRVADRGARPLRPVLGGSLGVGLMPVAGARPRDQAGDTPSTAGRPSVAAVVVVAVVTVGHGPVPAGARPRAQAGDAASAPRRSIAAVVIVASGAVGRRPVAHGLAPVTAVVRPVRAKSPLSLASAPVIDTVPVARPQDPSSDVPRVTGSVRLAADAVVARPGCGPAPSGEPRAWGVPVPAPVKLLKVGVGVPNPAPALLLRPAGAGGPSSVSVALQALPCARWPWTGVGCGRNRAS